MKQLVLLLLAIGTLLAQPAVERVQAPVSHGYPRESQAQLVN